MKKRDIWKQPTPGMQLTTILSALKGNKSIYEMNVISKGCFFENFEDLTDQLLEIAKSLHENTSWEK